MAQSLFTVQEPASQDLSDGIVLMLGSYITPAVDGLVTHIRYRFPETVQPDVKAALFQTSDGAKIGADVTFTAPVLDAWNQVALASPVPVLAGQTVCPAVRVLRYVATFGGGVFPITNGDLSALSDAGRFQTSDPDGTVQFPIGSGGTCYFVDLVFDVVVPAEGAAAVVLDLAPAAAGRSRRRGAAALGLNLAVAAAGRTRRGGAAALGLNLAPAAAGRSRRGGAAAFGLDLGLVGTGRARRGGVAALGLNLAVAAAGSASTTPGRPVSNYPWTPRPVRSFSEVLP